MATATKPNFVDCLSSDAEYQKEYQRLNELQECLKKLEMGDAFGAYPYEQDKNIVDEAVEKTRQGEVTEPISIKTARQRTQDEMFLKRKAIEKQKAILERMKPRIWRAAASLHEPEAKELFVDLINSAETFLACMIELKQHQCNLRDLCGIDDKVLPWRVEEGFFRECGMTLHDGGGYLRTFIELSKKRINNETSI